MVYKQNTAKIPVYLDGKFEIYEIKQIDDINHREYLHKTDNSMWYEELSITDRLKYEFEQREKKITFKIRISQTKELNSLNVLKIGDEYHHLYNSFHFINKDGFPQTDLTLENYNNVLLEEDL